MKFTLKDKTFAIKSATLSAAIPDPYWSAKYNPSGDARLFWSLEVICEAGEDDDDGEMWEPRIYHEDLHFPIRRWMNVAGQTVEWSKPAGGIYVFEHERISRARLRFLERDGARIRFDWEGCGDVRWDDEYGEDVPFTASGWAEFTQVIVRGSESDTDETLRTRLAAYFDPGDFIQQPISPGGRYDSGVRMAHGVFIPRVAPEA